VLTVTLLETAEPWLVLIELIEILGEGGVIGNERWFLSTQVAPIKTVEERMRLDLISSFLT
jgi:hypothetical protein